jgi:FkbM family methyltransferase
MLSYAQNNEDLILTVLLGDVKKGFYVDVGANHPHHDSVTKLFYKQGWHGINIEPIASLHEELDKARSRDLNLNVGVALKKGELVLREYGDGAHGLSTFSKELIKSREVPFSYTEHRVMVFPLAHIFEQYHVESIDFLKVDVEGFEYEVLKSNDWKKWRPKVVVIENTPGKWPKLMEKIGYKEVFFDGLNRYYCSNEEVAKLTPMLFMQEYNKTGALAAKKQ